MSLSKRGALGWTLVVQHLLAPASSGRVIFVRISDGDKHDIELADRNQVAGKRQSGPAPQAFDDADAQRRMQQGRSDAKIDVKRYRRQTLCR